MKVLMLNGSCNPKGCTYTALTEVGKTLSSQGIDYEIVQLGGGPVRDCIGCNQCSKNGCVFAFNEDIPFSVNMEAQGATDAMINL